MWQKTSVLSVAVLILSGCFNFNLAPNNRNRARLFNGTYVSVKDVRLINCNLYEPEPKEGPNANGFFYLDVNHYDEYSTLSIKCKNFENDPVFVNCSENWGHSAVIMFSRNGTLVIPKAEGNLLQESFWDAVWVKAKAKSRSGGETIKIYSGCVEPKGIAPQPKDWVPKITI